MGSSKLVTIRHFSNAAEAAITRSLLEGAGIRVMAKGELWSGIYPIDSTWTEVELQVSEEDAELARQVLSASFDPSEFRQESDRSDDSDE